MVMFLLQPSSFNFLTTNSPPNAVGLSSTNVMIGGHALLVGLTEILQLTASFRSVICSAGFSVEKWSPERSKRVT